MNPRTLGAFVLLGRFVGSCPIVLGIPPQSGEGERESGWVFDSVSRLEFLALDK